MVGCVLHGDCRVLAHRTKRCWRLYYTLCELLRRRRGSGRQLRVVAGHLVHHLSLQRPLLSVLCHIYDFVGKATDEIRPLPPELIGELKTCQGLCFVCESDLSNRHLNFAFCSDEGYALLETSAARGELLRCTEWKERWRFVPVHVADSSFDAGGCTGAAARDHTLAPKFLEWFNHAGCLQYRARRCRRSRAPRSSTTTTS